MSGCRISKVRMKNGGAEISVLKNQRTVFSESVNRLAESIYDDTHMVGWFTLYKDGSLDVGAANGDEVTRAQVKGACEHMKDRLIYLIFGD